jgi:hypothetical protein
VTIVDFARLRDDELPRLWGELMEEMRAREIITSGNSPIADIAERVVIDHLGGDLAPRNTAGHDVRIGRRRVQVKGLRQTSARKSSLSPIRSQNYSEVVVVVFDPGLRVLEILRTLKRWVPECGHWSQHVNGHVLSLSKLRRHPRTKQVDVAPRWRD